jgi:hypothetical protein
MNKDSIGRLSFSSKDLIDQIYQGNIDKLQDSKVEETDVDYVKYLEFINDLGLTDWPIPLPKDKTAIDIDTFDKMSQHCWKMPGEYTNIPVGPYLLGLCKTVEETNRVELELELFEKYNMLDLLKYLKFLVDTMRKNNVLWGVGRGSSVASYCLYLLGIHKINSLKYNLDIREFLR